MYTHRQNKFNTKGQLTDVFNVCNVNKYHIKHTAQNKKWTYDTSSNLNVTKKNRLIGL